MGESGSINNKFFYIFGASLVGLLLFGGFLVNRQESLGVPATKIDKEDIFEKGEGSTIFTYNCNPGKTALELLYVRADNNVEIEDSSLGKFVTKIGSQAQENEKYWLYSIDGKEATISASAYICQDSEQIRWELK